MWSLSIFVALSYEKRDLVKLSGRRSLDGMARVPMIAPLGRRKA